MQRAILVGINLKGEFFDIDYSLHELKALAETLDYEIVYNIRQTKDKPDPATFIGKGKVEELGELIKRYQADIIIFDDILTPAQNRNLETILQIKVIDRTYLILEIFQKTISENDKFNANLIVVDNETLQTRYNEALNMNRPYINHNFSVESNKYMEMYLLYLLI